MEITVQEILTKGIKEKLDTHLETLIPNLMDHEFTEVTSWGEKRGTFTVKQRILAALEGQCQYKEGGYSYDKNAFSKALDKIVEEKMKNFSAQMKNEIDSKFVKEAMNWAEQKLRERLGVK